MDAISADDNRSGLETSGDKKLVGKVRRGDGKWHTILQVNVRSEVHLARDGLENKPLLPT